MATTTELRHAILGRPRDLLNLRTYHAISLAAVLAWVGLGADHFHHRLTFRTRRFVHSGRIRISRLPLALATTITVVETARRTMFYIAVSLASTASGLLIAYYHPRHHVFHQYLRGLLALTAVDGSLLAATPRPGGDSPAACSSTPSSGFFPATSRTSFLFRLVSLTRR